MTRHLAVLTAGVVAVGAQSFVLAPLLPDLATSLAATPTEIGRALAAYGIGVVAAALLLGPRLDRAPRRSALTAGAVALALAGAGSALAPNWEVLAGAQVVAGTGAGVVLPATYALAAELAGPGEGARATGRVLGGWSIALVAGVPLATVLADAVGWRGVLGALAVLAGAQAVLCRTLPDLGSRPASPVRIGVALRIPGVAPLLAGTLAFMSAFYAVFGFAGAEIRLLHGGGAAGAGLLALAYGVGFGLGAATDRYAARVGLAPAFAALVVVYLLLAVTVGLLPAMLAAALVWGLVNHVALTLLVSRLSAAAPDARGAVLALNSAATYGGAALAGLLAGPLYEIAGLGWVAVAAGAVVVMAVPVTRTRPGTWTRPGTRTRPGTWTRPGTRTRPGTWTRSGTWARPGPRVRPGPRDRVAAPPMSVAAPPVSVDGAQQVRLAPRPGGPTAGADRATDPRSAARPGRATTSPPRMHRPLLVRSDLGTGFIAR